MNTFYHDLRYGLRTLLKNPAFTLAAVVTLALGIGANSVIFSIVNWTIWRPLPASNPDQLAVLYSSSGSPAFYGSFSYPDYRDFRDQATAFSQLIAYQPLPLSLSAGGENQRVWGEIVSGNYFSMLGLAPALGRGFLPEEDQTPGTHPVAILSYDMWQRRLAADPTVVGRSITLNGRRFTIVGVAPKGFYGVYYVGFRPEIWVPTMMYDQVVPGGSGTLERRGATSFRLMGRLEPGVTVAQAQREVSSIASQLATTYPKTNQGLEAALFAEKMARPEPSIARGFLFAAKVFLGVVSLVLLIACANVASLLLSRAAARRKEIALRAALGASRGRLLRQLLTESLVLAALGGLAGLLLALWGTQLLALIRLPTDLPFGFDFTPDLRVLAFTATVSLLTGVVFGMAPALQLSRFDGVQGLRGDRTLSERAARPSRLRAALVAGQVAVSLVLLICAALFLKSLGSIRAIDAGFDPTGGVLLTVDPGLQGYEQERGKVFYRQVLERLERLPGVVSASAARFPPLEFSASGGPIYIEGRAESSTTENAFWSVVGPKYLETMGTALREGRAFAAYDTAGAPGVVIVNETMARRYWPGSSPIGRVLRINTPDGPPLQVVGVAADGKYRNLTESPTAFLYLPLEQNYTSSTALIIRATQGPESVIAAARAEIQQLDPQMPVSDVKTLKQLVEGRALLFPRFGAALVSIFGVLALVLASVGLYGVISYTVSQRAREMGIRAAMGARPGQVRWLVVRQGMTLAVIGLGVGLLAALALTRLVSSLLFGVSTTDPMMFAAVTIALAAVALLASYVPAHRASRADPMVALRSE